MRILHVNKFLYRRGGAEAYMEDVAQLQQDAGHDVAFFGMAHPENVHLEWAQQFPSYLELDPPPQRLGDRGRAAARMLWSSSARHGIGEVLDRFRPDVVHFHNIYHQLSPSVIGPAKASGAVTVLTVHDYKLACPSYLMLDKGTVCEACLGGHFSHAVRRRCKDGSLVGSALLALELSVHTAFRLYGGIDVFLCPSRFMLAKMTEAGVFPDRLRVLHNFIDVSALPVKQAPGGPIVYASRLSEEKGVDVLVNAMASLARDVRLEVAGDGPQREALEGLAERVAPGRVTFHGRIAKPDVARLVARAGVVAAPSRCYENQPLAVLEAFGAGVPVVGSNLGGIAELVRPGETGELAEPGDATGLARAIAAVLDDPKSAMDMGMRARALVTSDYSPLAHLTALNEVYSAARPADHPS